MTNPVNTLLHSAIKVYIAQVAEVFQCTTKKNQKWNTSLCLGDVC